MEESIKRFKSKYYITSVTNLEGIIISASDSFCRLSGYSKLELVGQNHSIVRHPDTPNEVFENMWKTIKSGKIWSGIIKNKKKNGDYYWVDSIIEPLTDENGKIIGYSSLRVEITDKIELEDAKAKLESSVKRFEKLFENIDSGIVVFDKNGLIQDANSYLCELAGLKKEEFIGTSSFELSTNKDKIIIKDIITKILNGEIKNQKIHKELIRKDGSKIWIEVTYSYFEENVILASVNNISNFKKLEVATNLLVSQSRDAAMGEMLSMIAHQWRQPLATLGTILSKIKIKQDLDLYSKENFNTDFQKLNSIIIHLSKTIDYFKPKTAIKEDITSIFSGLNNIIEPLCDKNNIELVFNNTVPKEVKIDSRIDQVLLNIYKNSIDACFEKNKKGKVVTNVKLLDDCVVIDISDNGGGIEESVIDKIFEPYFSTKSKNGTGLGLYMNKIIVENHFNGKLKVKNTEQGAKFFIELPINDIKK